MDVGPCTPAPPSGPRPLAALASQVQLTPRLPPFCSPLTDPPKELGSASPLAGPGFRRLDDQWPWLGSVPLEVRPSPSPYPRTVGAALQDTGSLQM